MPEETIFQGKATNMNQDKNSIPDIPVVQNQPQVVTPKVQNPAQTVTAPTNEAWQNPGFTPPPQSPQPPASPQEPKKPGRFNKKILFVILGFIVIILLAFIFISIFSHKTSNPTAGNATLTYWGFADQSQVEPAIAGFEKENPGIKITYVKQDSSDYIAKLKARIPQGNGPDIYVFNNSWLTSLSSYLLPLPQNVMDNKQFSQKYYDSAQKDLIRSGAIYGIPQNSDSLALFINMDLFSATDQASLTLPKTWQDFVDSAGSLTKRDDQGKIIQGGAGIGSFDNVNHASDLMGLLFNQNGVDYRSFSASQDKISQALTFYTDFAQVENNVWDENQDNSLLAFEQGKLAMYFGYFSDIDQIKSQSPSLNYKIIPVPQLTPDTPQNITTYFADGVSVKTAHQEESYLFIKYLIDHNFSVGLSPEKAFSSQDPNQAVFLGEAKTAQSSPFAAASGDQNFSGALISALGDSVNSVLSGSSADDGAASLISGYSKVISSLNNSTQGK